MNNLYYIKQTKYGRGVFATRNIKIGEKIFTMDGNRISKENLHLISKSGRSSLVDPLQVSENKFINMIEPYVLVNHSCNPNAGIKNGNLLVAIKNIKKNEEILYDYSSVWFEGFICKCGQPNCRKYIGDFSGLPKKNQRRYIKLGIVPNFIKKRIK